MPRSFSRSTCTWNRKIALGVWYMVGKGTGDVKNETLEQPIISSSPTIPSFSKEGNLDPFEFDTQWDEVDTTLSEVSHWNTKDTSCTLDSPGLWDPNAFEQQAPDSWRESKEPKRIQDIKSPLLIESDSDQERPNSDEEWPFRSPCKMEELKKKKKMTPKPDIETASDIDSDEELPPISSNGDKFMSGSGGDSQPATVRPTVSTDLEEADEMKDEVEDETKRSTSNRRGSSHSSKSSKESSTSRRGRKKSQEHSAPRDGQGTNVDAEEEKTDRPPSKPTKTRRNSVGESEQSSEDIVSDVVDPPKKPKRRGTKTEVIGEDDDEEAIAQGSFHKLAKDFDKKPSRSSSKGRKIRAPGSAGSSARRRRVKERSMDLSGHSNSTGDDDIDEFAEEEHEIKLKGEDDENTPGSGPKSWRDRRASNRAARERELFEGRQVIQAPGSGGRRPPTSRRGQVRRASSERWMRAVEGVDVEDEEADEVVVDRGQELSRSAHGIRRYHSGGVGRLAVGLGSASYHGVETGRQRTPNRRPPRKSANHTPTSDNSGGGSFAGDDYEYDINLSARSARTLDSIEDLEDFEHIDFQTPGIIDYDEEILELMQKANPEHTAQLQRRVQRRREAVNYDQNMPMMTRQALMTRTASTQVQRQFVDQSTIDHQRLLVRSISSSSAASNDQLSMSQHREQFARGAPIGRRPPPRTRSSGMAALSRSEHPYSHGAPRVSDSDDRRRLFRTKSGASTSSFRQNQKPNRVQSISRRPDGLDTSRKGPPDERKGSLSRAKSMHATVGRTRAMSPKRAESNIPKSIETKANEVPPDDDKETPKDDSSVSEDSDVESDEDLEIVSPQKPSRLVPMIKVAPTPPPPKKKTDKRDFTVKRNRAKLHSMLYESKMGVDMKELLTQVQQGEVTRSPIHSLMMPSP